MTTLAVFMGATHYLKDSFAMNFNKRGDLLACILAGGRLGGDVAGLRKQMDRVSLFHAAMANRPRELHGLFE